MIINGYQVCMQTRASWKQVSMYHIRL